MVRKRSRAAGALEGPFDARRVRATWRTTPRAPRRTTAWPRVATDDARGASASYTTGALHPRSTPVYTGGFIFISVWAIETDVVFFFTPTEPRVGVPGAANDARTWYVIRRGRGASVWCAGAVPRRAICARGSCARANAHGCQPRVPVGEINWDGPTLGGPRARACAARLSARARVPMKPPRCGRWYRRVAPRLMPPHPTSAMSSSGVAGGPNARRRGERGGPSRC